MPPVRPLACVIGDMDLLRPLGLAGIRCAVPDAPGTLPRRSRFTKATFPLVDPVTDPAGFGEGLAAFAAGLAEPPVLFYQGDWDMLAISRQRDALALVARFALADRELVEDLTDKARFLRLAERLELPVPAAAAADPAAPAPSELDVPFPWVIKPVTRVSGTWNALASGAKAIGVRSTTELTEVWPALAGAGPLIVQELVPGPETLIESYHVYVDAGAAIAGEFTGRKLRTYPTAYGHSTAVEITDAPDVRELGRALVDRLGLHGVAKFDFKRAPDGRLLLLEVNPRFSLWHHPGALAGVNLPALVHADMTDTPRPPTGSARAGVRWCHPGTDLRACRAAGLSVPAWLRFVAGSRARSRVALDDPVPLLAGLVRRT